MSRWKSNGDNYSPNEDRLEGERVVLKQGRTEWVGVLKQVRARTRGNWTLAVVYKTPREVGKAVRREQLIWTMRQKPFTIERAPESLPNGRYKLPALTA